MPAQLRLLYANANLGVVINILAATVLGGLQWGVVARPLVIAWWLYILLVSVARYALARHYWHSSPAPTDSNKWRTVFIAGVALTGAGWGAAGVLLYPAAHLTNQVFLVFVLGGMMLGASSVLAPRPEAFLTFLLPAGLIPAVRLFLEGDETHVAMGLLAVVFTLATLIITRRIYRTIESSLRLQLENRDLVENLRAAHQETVALNFALERRVQERTAELRKSTEQLRAEIAQREQTEEELLRSRKLESLGVLAGGIAHDFNNFLTVVQGNIEVAKTQLTRSRAGSGIPQPGSQRLPARQVPVLSAANFCQRRSPGQAGRLRRPTRHRRCSPGADRLLHSHRGQDRGRPLACPGRSRPDRPGAPQYPHQRARGHARWRRHHRSAAQKILPLRGSPILE